MRCEITSGYSSIDSSIVYVRDMAFASAAPDDILMVWETEDAFENNGPELGIFRKRDLTPLDQPAVESIDDGYNDYINTEYENDADNEPVTGTAPADYAVGDTVIVKLRGTVLEADEFGIDLRYEIADGGSSYVEIELNYNDPNFIDIVKVKTLQHPPPGGFAQLKFTKRPDLNGRYLLGIDNKYYGVEENIAGIIFNKDDNDISNITIT